MNYAHKEFSRTLDFIRKIYSPGLELTQEDPEFVMLKCVGITEASSFVKAYEAVTGYRFRQYNCAGYRFSQYNCTSGLRGFHFKEDYACLRSFVKKTSKRPDGSCKARIHIAVKEIKSPKDIQGNKKFKYPCEAVIHISLCHCHTDDLAPVKVNRISREVQESFYEFFSKGISGKRAKDCHELKLLQSNNVNLGDHNINPHIETVYSLYRKWKNLINKGQARKESILDSISASHIVKDAKQSVMNSTGNSNIQRAVSHSKSESEVQVGNSEQSKIKRETIDEGNFPKIVSCCSLAPDADNTAVPYPSASRSSVKPSSRSQSVPLVANSAATLQNSIVVPANTCVSVMRVEPVDNTQLIVYNKSTNSFQVVKYLKLCSTSESDHSTQFTSCLPHQMQFPTRG